MNQKSEAASLSVAQRIDVRCDQFEAQWRAGRRPRIEDFLAATPAEERAGLFRALLAVELELRLKQGEPLDPGPYRQRFPDQRATIEAVFREVGGAAQSVRDLASRDTSVSQSGERRPQAPTEPFQGNGVAVPSVPQRIGRFEVLALLGEGAFGKVYKARDPHLDREVAIKVPQPGAQEKDRDLERFLREAKAAANIRHPNICPVYEVGKDGALNYIVMAFVPGQSLAANIANRKEPMPAKQAALVCRKLALALEAAHAKGIIHRDLKPSNIMFDRDRKDVVVMDFGLARQVRKEEAQLTQSGVIMGTPSYMPPEQACGEVQAIGPWSDVYSLGVILYEMLTGRRPYEGSVAEVLGQLLHVAPEPPSKLRPDLDPKLEAVCLKAMAKDHRQRYRSMKELADALNECLKVAPPEAKPVAAQAAGSETRQFAEMVQALSAERKAETEAAVRRAKTPFWLLLATGVGFLAAVVVLGLIFFARTPTATVTIVLEGINLQDASLSYFLDGQGIKGAELEKPIELKIGDHVLLVKRGPALLKEFRFVVRGGREPGIDIREKIDHEEKAPPPPGDGFVSLFNGKDLSGWTRPDGSRATWRVQDGYMEVGPKAGHILTQQTFGPDFQLHAEFWIPLMPAGKGQGRGNSGIFLQGRYEVQIVDAFNNEPGRPDQTIGALYGTIAPRTGGIKPPETWQTFDITFRAPRVDGKGDVSTPGRITVVLNGVTVIDDQPFDRVAPGQALDTRIGAPGPIMLQDHGCPVRFRNIRIKELKPDLGWQPLFNGKDLAGWDGLPGYWRWDKDELIGRFPQGQSAHTFLCSHKRYRDFELRFEAKLIGGPCNSGVQFRSVVRDSSRYTTFGPQIEISNTMSRYPSASLLTEPKGPPDVPADRAAVEKVQKPDDWNAYTLKVVGPHVTITLNGLTTVDADFSMDPAGILAWQIHGQMKDREVRFRNMQIKERDAK